MGRIRIKVLEPEYETATAMLMDAIAATTGTDEVVEVERVRDPEKIKKFNVEAPAIVINDKVMKFTGAPRVEEIKKWVAEL